MLGAASKPPFTPQMQLTMDSIVFASPTVVKKTSGESKPNGGSPGASERSPSVAKTKSRLTWDSGDDSTHHVAGSTMTSDRPLQENKHAPTATDYGNSLLVSDSRDRGNEFDQVYSLAHASKDTESHFTGLVLDASADPQEAARNARQAEYIAAKQSMSAAGPAPERRTMGAEQLDSVDHFAGGSMCCASDAPISAGFDPVYGLQHVNKDTESHFKAGAMVIDESPNPPPMRLCAPQLRHIKDSHFVGATLLVAVEESKKIGAEPPPPLALTKEEMVPPQRSKFLNDGGPRELSEQMQAEVAQIVFASSSPAAFSPAASSPTKRVPAATPVGGGGGAGGGGGGGGGGGSAGGSMNNNSLVEGRAGALPKSLEQFAWSSERIAHELVCKLDTFTHRREDHMRKLLWTVGTDPQFESGLVTDRNAIKVTPKNFGVMCSRFGIVCNESQADEIFEKHKLPKEGCNMYTLATRFLESGGNTADINRKSLKSSLVRSGRDQETLKPDPFKFPSPERVQEVRKMDRFTFARMPNDAWREHQQQATSSFAVEFGAILGRQPLPPISCSKD